MLSIQKSFISNTNFNICIDGYLYYEDAVGVMGTSFISRLEATSGRGGRLTFAPPVLKGGKTEVDSEAEVNDAKSFWELFSEFVEHFALGSVAGGIGKSHFKI